MNKRYGQDNYESTLRFESDLGRRLDIVNKFHSFSNHTYGVEAAHLADGRIPMISWRATDGSRDPDRAVKISNGVYDTTIRETARAVRALGGTVLIRFNWEMDQDAANGRQHIGSPGEFIQAWRHVVQIFRSEGAHNAEFVWAPRANAFNKGTAQPFYPGDSWVDWIGGSAVPINSYRDFTDIYQSFLDWGTARNKPLLVWIGVREQAGNPGYKAEFINQAMTTLTQNPAVRAFVWYHALSPKGNEYWADTTVRSFNAFKQMACTPYFDPFDRCGDNGDPSGPTTKSFSGQGNSAGDSWQVYSFHADAGSRISATLGWDNANANLNLFLRPPGASSAVVWANGTTDRPESLSQVAGASGTWTIAVKTKSEASDYTIDVVVD